jgi:hypothetical protein
VSIFASELDVKRLEILHEYVPQARRIAVLGDPTTISTRPQLVSGARDLGVELVWFEASDSKELGRTLDAIATANVEAVNVLASPVLNNFHRPIVERLRDARLPAIYQWPEIAEDGGLLAYGPRILLCYRYVVSLVDKVLRGAKPAATFLTDRFHQETETHQMRENLSLLSFWGLVFSLIAVTLFVVIYSYQKSKYANREIVEVLRQRSVDVYLAAKTPEAESDSKRFREASNEIARLRAETRVLFWLIIAMNTAVIIIFILAYQYF